MKVCHSCELLRQWLRVDCHDHAQNIAKIKYDQEILYGDVLGLLDVRLEKSISIRDSEWRDGFPLYRSNHRR